MKIGLKYFKYVTETVATDANGAETETYGNEVKTAAKAMSLSVTVNRADTKGYADDETAETDPSFIGGKITIEADDLTNAVISELCGVTHDNAQGGTGDLTFSDVSDAHYVRFGFLVPMIKKGDKKWVGIVFTRVKFSEPEDNYQPKGQSIEFRGWTLNGDIMRNKDGIWKIQSDRKSESDALTWLNATIKPAAQTPGT